VATIDDQYLTRLVAQGVEKAHVGLTIGDVRLTIGNLTAHIAPNNVVQIVGQVLISPDTPIGDLSIQAQIGASEGTLALDKLKGTAGPFAVEGGVADPLTAAINARLATEKDYLTRGGIHYSISGLSSAEGRLTIFLTFS